MLCNRVMLTGGQVHDLQKAAYLIENEQTGAVVAEKAYDSDVLNAFIEQAVVLPEANRREPQAYDENLYAGRNKVERFFKPLKQYRRFATAVKNSPQLFSLLADCLLYDANFIINVNTT